MDMFHFSLLNNSYEVVFLLSCDSKNVSEENSVDSLMITSLILVRLRFLKKYSDWEIHFKGLKPH